MLLVFLTGCEQEEVFYEASDPRPAVSTEAPVSASTRFKVSPESRVRFELSSRDHTTRGQLPLVRGELTVQLGALSQGSGRVAVDLGALRLTDLEDEAEARLRAERARNWLNLGASRPEAARERSRWATFSLTAIKPSTESVYEARRRALTSAPSPSQTPQTNSPHGRAPGAAKAPATKPPAPPRHAIIAPRAPGEDVELPEPDEALQDAATDAGPEARPAIPEQRSLRAVLSGQLALNQFRKEIEAEVTVSFEFPDRASPSVAPTRVLVTSVKPFRVSLSDFAIVPRDTHGVVDTAQDELKRRAGGEARVSLTLVLEPL